MIIKVCGIKEQSNYNQIADLGIDMIGLNFYKPSKRYIGSGTLSKRKEELRVGIFVQEEIDVVIAKSKEHQLDFVQLHGDETPQFCEQISSEIPIIKVFRVDENFDWKITDEYQKSTYFLFDTYTKAYGGSGKKFDWTQIEKYKGSTPFLLSGGISPEDATGIKEISHPLFKGIDINSKFETEPGIKDIDLIQKFIEEINH